MVSAIRRGDIDYMEREMWFEAPSIPCITSSNEDLGHAGMFDGFDLDLPVLSLIPETCARRWNEGCMLTAFILWWDGNHPPLGLERVVQVDRDAWSREGWCLDGDDDAWFYFATGGMPWQPWRPAGGRRPKLTPEDYCPDAPDATEVWNEQAMEWVPLERFNLVFTVRPGSFILLRSRPARDDEPQPDFDEIRQLLRAVHINETTTLLEALPFAESAWWTCTPTEMESADWQLYRPSRPW